MAESVNRDRTPETNGFDPMAESISVVCFLWDGGGGGRGYRPEHVNKLAEMVDKHLSCPHRFICVTDETGGFSDRVELFQIPESAAWIKDVRTPEKPHLPSSYRRLWLFSDEARVLGDRILQLDIDCLIVGNLDPLFQLPDDFVGWRPKSEWRPKLKVRSATGVRRIGGGTWLLRTGTHTHVWEDFTPAGIMAAREQGWRGSDQAWLSHKLAATCKVFPISMGIYHTQDGAKKWEQVPTDATIIHFNGKINPWDEEAQSRPWVCRLLGVPYRPEKWVHLKAKNKPPKGAKTPPPPPTTVKPAVDIVLYWWDCWPTTGGPDLGRVYVRNAVAGIKRHIPDDIDTRVVLFTDQPRWVEGIDGLDARPLKSPVELRWNLRKMFMYSKGAKLTNPVLCFDLDCLFVGDLTPLLHTVIDLHNRLLITCAGAYRKGRLGGSVIGFKPTSKLTNLLWHPLLTDARPKIERITKGSERRYLRHRLRRDQVLLWDKILPGKVLSFKRDCKDGLPSGASVVRFHGKPRPHDVVSSEFWVKEHWTCDT